jgi:hypothetical protein
MMIALGHFDANSPAAREIVTVVLIIALFTTASTLIFRDKIVARYAARVGALNPKHVAMLTTCVGAVLGALVTISSVGAGAIGVTALILLYPQLPTARIVGSDIAHAVPLTLAAGIGHWFLGAIDLQVFASLILGSVPGILLGSYAAARIPETALRLVLAATLFVVAAKLTVDVHGSRSSANMSITEIGVRAPAATTTGR